MYYILDKEISLRSYQAIPYTYSVWHKSGAKRLRRDEFMMLLKCDGRQDLEDSALLQDLLARHLVHPCQEGEQELTQWQKWKVYDNLYIPFMNLQITGYCNYNCHHCFNASDNRPVNTQLTYEEILSILDQAASCGIQAFTITGGEPLLHKDFLRIIKAIYERDMFVREINTNGHFLDERLLDELQKIGCKCKIKISFDGLGWHNWLRNNDCAEQTAIRAMKLCIAKGFKTMAQINLFRYNMDCISETLRFLDEIGVAIARIIRTTEVPRLIERHPEICIGISEYYDKAQEIIADYTQETHKMRVVFWQFVSYDPVSGYKHYYPLRCRDHANESELLCSNVRGMIAVSSSGKVYPCMQAVGTLEADGAEMDSILKTPLKEILKDSQYVKQINLRVSHRWKQNAECRQCSYWELCRGGCPALGYVSSGGDWLGIDRWKCIFFHTVYPTLQLP